VPSASSFRLGQRGHQASPQTATTPEFTLRFVPAAMWHKARNI